MQFLKQDDPRDALEKATRDELVQFAHAKGQSDISEMMPAVVIRKTLRERGLTNINIPNRPLGAYTNSAKLFGLVDGPPVPPQSQPQQQKALDADELLMAEWKNKQESPAVESMTMGELRAHCKRVGIKMARTDNMETLKAKLRGNATS